MTRREIVEPDHDLPKIEQSLYEVRPDKPGRSRHEPCLRLGEQRAAQCIIA
jgi:hypothetical protein